MTRLFFSILAGAAALGALAACNAIVDADQYRFASGDVSADAGVDAGPQCNVNADCTGSYQICRKSTHACVNLITPECDHVQGNWQDDNAVIFGSVLPTRGADKSSGLPPQDALDLVVSDFANAGGLPPVPGATAHRPLVLVGCDDNSDSDQAVRAADHLGSIGVPAIVGAAFSGITIQVANRSTIKNNVLLISPSATSTELTSLIDNGLVWRTSPSDILQAKAAVALYPLIETELKKTRAAAQVAIAFKGDSYGSGLANAVSQSLRVNGQPATATANAENFQYLDYGNPDDPASTLKYDATAAAIIAKKPQVIFLFGITETITEMMSRIEAGYTTNAITPKPTYVLADGSLLPELPVYLEGHPDVRTRVLGTIYGSNSQAFNVFKTKYAAGVTDGSSADTAGTSTAYDALYNLAFATVAAGAKPLDGAAIRDGLGKLVPGPQATSWTVGTDAITNAFRTLLAGNNLDYSGASGPLDYDLATGEAASDIQIWCVPKDASGKPASGRPSGGTYYRASDGTLQGTLDDIAAGCQFK